MLKMFNILVFFLFIIVGLFFIVKFLYLSAVIIGVIRNKVFGKRFCGLKRGYYEGLNSLILIICIVV